MLESLSDMHVSNKLGLGQMLLTAQAGKFVSKEKISILLVPLLVASDSQPVA